MPRVAVLILVSAFLLTSCYAKSQKEALLERLTRTEKVCGEMTESGPNGVAIAVWPPYPIRAMKKGIQGYVEFGFDVGVDGQPINIEVLVSNPPGVFEKAGMLALREWRYCPSHYGRRDEVRTLLWRLKS